MGLGLNLRVKWRYFRQINWFKTLYFNFKKFPFSDAVKLPVLFYGGVRFTNISGTIEISRPYTKGMVGFGQPYESRKSVPGKLELHLAGTLKFHGKCQIGPASFIFVSENATCEMGHMSSLGFSGKIYCYDKIKLGDFARLGFESQIIDSSLHQMIDTETGLMMPLTKPVLIGNYNYIGNRVSFFKGSQTADFMTVASGSICVKDYNQFGPNAMIGGNPAQLIKSNISRDWKSEAVLLESWVAVP